MDLWLGLFIWLCGIVMGFASAIILMNARMDADDMEDAS
jgi:hypothetical protein